MFIRAIFLCLIFVSISYSQVSTTSIRVGKNGELTKNGGVYCKVYYPQKQSESVNAAIIFSHGMLRNSMDYSSLSSYWAKNGYIVINPGHGYTYWQDRIIHISSVIEFLNKRKYERIGVAGHSMGAMATEIIAGTKLYAEGTNEFKDYKNKKITAVITFAAPGRGGAIRKTSWEDIKIPFLCVVGGIDSMSGNTQTDPFVFSSGRNKFLYFIPNIDHGFGGISGRLAFMKSPRLVKEIQEVSLTFWDACLKRDKSAVIKLFEDERLKNKK